MPLDRPLFRCFRCSKRQETTFVGYLSKTPTSKKELKAAGRQVAVYLCDECLDYYWWLADQQESNNYVVQAQMNIDWDRLTGGGQ